MQAKEDFPTEAVLARIQMVFWMDGWMDVISAPERKAKYALKSCSGYSSAWPSRAYEVTDKGKA